MDRLTYKTLLYGAAGGLGGIAAWAPVLALSQGMRTGLLTEISLGALTGMFIGGFIWSHEAVMSRQFLTALKRAAFGALAGIVGGALGAGMGTTAFSALGRYVADLSGFRASLGIALSVALGWAVLGAAIGMSGGVMIRSRERAGYGLAGGLVGGFFGGILFNSLSATNVWSALAGLSLLGLAIGAFISLVEEAFVSAKLKVIKGRHLNREFPLLKEMNVVGRDDRADVCLSGAEGVLLEHASILRDNGRFTIETNETGKPVYVNEAMTTKKRLDDGDVIRVGSILLLFTAIRKTAALAAILMLVGLSLALPGTVLSADPASLQITQFDLSGFPVVKAYVSALDKEGKPVHGLTRESMTLKENGKTVVIDLLQMNGTNGEAEPLSLGIVVDQSESMTGDKLLHAKEAVIRFLGLMEKDDKASLVLFSDKVTTLSGLSNDQEALVKNVQAIEAQGHTALYDAVAAGVASVRGTTGRRAVIVLTDGIANRGALDIDQAIEAAVAEYVSVYVIGLGNDVRTARLERIASETGGSYFFTPSSEGLSAIYETISKRIHNEYTATFTAEKRGDYLRKISLSLAAGLSAERAYFQPESSLFGAGGMAPSRAFAATLAALVCLLALSLRRIEQQYKTAHLTLVRGAGTKTNIPVGATASIGRDGRSTLGLKDSGIDQQHARVKKSATGYVIEDKGSAQGTYVNKTRVLGTKTLKDGDVITMGNATIVFNEGTTKICAECGEPVRMAAKFCAKCGAKAA
ncbi:MAG: VWA domain-containing protein [Nitrospirota bacterium]|nr:VWA domain-containing protein [Nitrospirota bacterium]